MGVVPIVTVAVAAFTANETIKQQKKQARQAQAQATVQAAAQANEIKRQQKDVEKQSQAEIKAIDAEREVKEKKLQRNLKEQMASRRARMASSGLRSTGGSADALFKGMVGRVENEMETGRNFDEMDVSSIQSNLESRRRKNLFAISSQQSRLSLSSGYKSSSPYFNAGMSLIGSLSTTGQGKSL